MLFVFLSIFLFTSCCGEGNNLLVDGSFEHVEEKGTWNVTVVSLNWTRAKNDTPGPEDGDYFVWLAGFGVMGGSVEQFITIDNNHNHKNYIVLVFSYWITIESTGPNNSTFSLLFGNQLLRSYTYKDTDYFPKWTRMVQVFTWNRNQESTTTAFRLEYYSTKSPLYYLTHYFVDNVTIEYLQ
jgi:hypothetical protein